MCSKVPSLREHYLASSLLRTWPPPSRLRSTSRFVPVIRPRLLHRFPDGARTVSPVAQHVLVTVLSLTTPPECHAASVSVRRAMLPSPRRRGFDLQTYFFVEATAGFTCV